MAGTMSDGERNRAWNRLVSAARACTKAPKDDAAADRLKDAWNEFPELRGDKVPPPHDVLDMLENADRQRAEFVAGIVRSYRV